MKSEWLFQDPSVKEDNLIRGAKQELVWLGFAWRDGGLLTGCLLFIAAGYCMVLLQTVRLLSILKKAKIGTSLILKTAK